MEGQEGTGYIWQMENEKIFKLKEQLKYVEFMINQCYNDDDFGLKAFSEEKARLVNDIYYLENSCKLN